MIEKRWRISLTPHSGTSKTSFIRTVFRTSQLTVQQLVLVYLPAIYVLLCVQLSDWTQSSSIMTTKHYLVSVSSHTLRRIQQMFTNAEPNNMSKNNEIKQIHVLSFSGLNTSLHVTIFWWYTNHSSNTILHIFGIQQNLSEMETGVPENMFASYFFLHFHNRIQNVNCVECPPNKWKTRKTRK